MGRVILDITIPGRVRSFNWWRSKHWAVQARARDEWKMAAFALAREAGSPGARGPVEVAFEVSFARRARRDLDNYSQGPELKAVQDALVAAGVIDDDSVSRVVSRSVSIVDGGADWLRVVVREV